MFNIQTEGDVPGMILPEQCETLKKVASTLPDNANILEIGCWAGKSTWCWLSGLSSNASMTTVDPFVLDHRTSKHAKRQKKIWYNETVNEVMRYFVKNGGVKTWRAVINEHPNKIAHKNLYVGYSQNFALENDTVWDCVYIDGDHSYEGVTSDLHNFEPRTTIICGDDYKPESRSLNGINIKAQLGVVNAVNEMCERTGRKLWVDPDSCFWMATKN